MGEEGSRARGEGVTHEHFVAQIWPANEESAVEAVIAPPNEENDGWSPWVWLRLSNGDLILGRFPQGDTYFEQESAVDADYVKAEKRLNAAGGIRTVNNEYDGDE